MGGSEGLGRTLTPADAATLILVRQTPDGPAVLMGQRGSGAAFMPSKFVFPGGRVDLADRDAAFATPLDPGVADHLCRDTAGPADPGLAPALAAAAIRELAEETGLHLSRAVGSRPDAPRLAHAAPLSFIFRAVTPPGPPRRFDARFLLADAQALDGDPDDMSAASGELSHLAWVPLTRARDLALPFITEIVLAEVTHLATTHRTGPGARADGVPFFDNRGPQPLFRRIL